MLPGHPRVVNAHQFAEFQPVIFRNRLDAPQVSGGVLALGAFGRSQHRLWDLALQGVVGVANLE